MEGRPEIANLRPYEPGRPADALRRELGVNQVVKLASNEGPLGPFPSVVERLREAVPLLNRYPELSHDLRKRLAERHGVAPQRIWAGNGAVSIIGDLALALLRPGDEVLMGWPSFVAYPIGATAMGAAPVQVPLRSTGVLDLDAMAGRIGERTRIVYACSPNNPTGGIVHSDELRRFAERVPQDVLLVVDAAYHEYVTDPGYGDAVADLGDLPNVAVLRSFSKVYGLAGMRVGYMVGPPEVVAAVSKIAHPFGVSELAHVAAIASLDDQGEVERRREANTHERERLRVGLEKLGLRPLPAEGNFLFADVGDGRELAGRLERAGVIVRPLEPFGAPSAVRITVGLPEENEALLQALAACLEPATT
ncbi:MAG: histidinol-phosphate aminotransferase [Gaiellales bacterium]|jgi:histidinol-phosphate aminotransferase|nr:histidinol-phosphate aminotransferase [Gaiellales bacterium]